MLQVVIWGTGTAITLYVSGVPFVLGAIDLIMTIVEIAQSGVTLEVIGKAVWSFIELWIAVFVAWILMSITGFISATFYD